MRELRGELLAANRDIPLLDILSIIVEMRSWKPSTRTWRRAAETKKKDNSIVLLFISRNILKIYIFQGVIIYFWWERDKASARITGNEWTNVNEVPLQAPFVMMPNQLPRSSGRLQHASKVHQFYWWNTHSQQQCVGTAFTYTIYPFVGTRIQFHLLSLMNYCQCAISSNHHRWNKLSCMRSVPSEWMPTGCREISMLMRCRMRRSKWFNDSLKWLFLINIIYCILTNVLQRLQSPFSVIHQQVGLLVHQ